MGGDYSSAVIQEWSLEEEMRALEAVVGFEENDKSIGKKKETKSKKNLKQILTDYKWEQQK